jgi:hypothetical protein
VPKWLATTLSAVFFLSFLAFVSWILRELTGFLLTVFAGLNPNVSAAIVAAVATVTVSVLTVIVGKALETRALINKELREKKSLVYEDFLKLWFKLAFGAKAGEAPVDEKEMIRSMSDLTQRLMVWGSNEVVTAWAVFRYKSMDSKRRKTLGKS